MRRFAKTTPLAAILIGAGALTALAATQYDISEIVLDAMSGHVLTIRPDTGSSGISVHTDVFALPDLDVIDMGPGYDVLSFGGATDYASAAIDFDTAFFLSANDDRILFNTFDDADRSNDELRVRSDNLVLQSNEGDVIIQLGN